MHCKNNLQLLKAPKIYFSSINNRVYHIKLIVVKSLILYYTMKNLNKKIYYNFL